MTMGKLTSQANGDPRPEWSSLNRGALISFGWKLSPEFIKKLQELQQKEQEKFLNTES